MAEADIGAVKGMMHVLDRLRDEPGRDAAVARGDTVAPQRILPGTPYA